MIQILVKNCKVIFIKIENGMNTGWVMGSLSFILYFRRQLMFIIEPTVNVNCTLCNWEMHHDLAKCRTTNLHQHMNRCKAKSRSASQPSSSSSLQRLVGGVSTTSVELYLQRGDGPPARPQIIEDMAE